MFFLNTTASPLIWHRASSSTCCNYILWPCLVFCACSQQSYSTTDRPGIVTTNLWIIAANYLAMTKKLFETRPQKKSKESLWQTSRKPDEQLIRTNLNKNMKVGLFKSINDEWLTTFAQSCKLHIDKHFFLGIFVPLLIEIIKKNSPVLPEALWIKLSSK